MNETLIAAAVLVVGVIVGIFLQPTPDQTRPISPAAGGGHAEPDHGHGHSH